MFTAILESSTRTSVVLLKNVILLGRSTASSQVRMLFVTRRAESTVAAFPREAAAASLASVFFVRITRTRRTCREELIVVRVGLTLIGKAPIQRAVI